MKRILFIEDDPILGRELMADFQEQGYQTHWSRTIKEARPLTKNPNFDLVLMDLNLPDGNTFELCREFREDSPSLPILILTSRLDEASALRGLSLGATDYLRKPFSRAELMLRLRRALGIRNGRIEIGSLIIDLDQRTATALKTTLHLTPTEFNLLALLTQRKGELVSKETLIQELSHEGDVLDKTLTSHLSRLRTKVSHSTAEIEIDSIYGEGYRLRKLE